MLCAVGSRCAKVCGFNRQRSPLAGGNICAGSRYSVMAARRFSRNQSAAARSPHQVHPDSATQSEVSTFPRMSTTLRSGRSAPIDLRAEGDPVPTVAATGRSANVAPSIPQNVARVLRTGVAAKVSSAWGAVGGSPLRGTPTSARPSMTASRTHLNTPTPPSDEATWAGVSLGSYQHKFGGP